MNDFEAIELLKKEPRNKEAIKYLYLTHKLNVENFLAYKLGDSKFEGHWNIAEDFYHQGFLKALDNINSYEANSFSNWIKTISYNLYKDSLKKKSMEIDKNEEKKMKAEDRRVKVLNEAEVSNDNGIKRTNYAYIENTKQASRISREVNVDEGDIDYLDNPDEEDSFSDEFSSDEEDAPGNFMKKEIKNCIQNAFEKFKKVEAKNQSDRAYVMSLLYKDKSLEEIAENIGRTYAATKVFISETKKKFIPFSKPCFDLLKD
jgi:RNA polymerase sigma factor (sigma-70 family)